MKYFFILGRNPELSRAEVFSYLECRGVGFKQDVFDGNFLVLELEREFDFNIQSFGGVLKLGKLDFFGIEKEFAVFLEKDELVEKDKFSYAVFGGFDLGEEMIKKKFKSEKRKAMLRHGRKQIKFQGDEVGNMPNADFYFFTYSNERDIYFGVVEQEFDNSGVRKRDMGKPYRREELAISPRLGRILVNLSGVKSGGRLLDCFCGVGGVLQEALVEGIEVIGVDRDKKAIQQAKENLAWIRKNFGCKVDYKLIQGDSSAISKEDVGEIGGIAAEAALGALLKKKISKKEAEEFIEKFENFIVPVLKNLKEIKGEDVRIAMTFPVVNSQRVDISGISKRAGLRVQDEFNEFGVEFPILESRSKQFVSRDFVVFY